MVTTASDNINEQGKLDCPIWYFLFKKKKKIVCHTLLQNLNSFSTKYVLIFFWKFDFQEEESPVGCMIYPSKDISVIQKNYAYYYVFVTFTSLICYMDTEALQDYFEETD